MFRRREGRGSDRNNETRIAENITTHPITLGDIDNLELLPGKAIDLLKHASIQRLGSSRDLKTAVDFGWVKLKNRGKNVVASAREAIIPAVLEDINPAATTSAGDIIANELIRNIITVSSPTYAALQGDDIILVNATSTITLPSAVNLKGYHFIIKNIKFGSTTTIATSNSETIDGGSTQSITVQYTSITVVSDGVNWFIV